MEVEMNATPEIIGLLAATIIFLIGMKLRERRILASQRVRRMHELLAEDIDGTPVAVPPPKRGLAQRLDGLGLKISPVAFYAISIGTAVGSFVVVQSMGLPLFPSLLGGLAGALLPKMWLDRREKALSKALSDALPEGLNTLASNLSTFPDLKVALGRTAELLESQSYYELAGEFSRLAADIGVMGPEEAIDRLRKRTSSDALRFTATLLGIYAAQGGKVLPALEARADNLRMLIEARKEAEGAVNDAKLAGLAVPIIMVLVVLANLRDPQAAEIYSTGIGQALLVGAAVSCYIGYRTVVSMAENIG
jgi:Flp pilus assembly protein TadB